MVGKTKQTTALLVWLVALALLLAESKASISSINIIEPRPPPRRQRLGQTVATVPRRQLQQEDEYSSYFEQGVAIGQMIRAFFERLRNFFITLGYGNEQDELNEDVLVEESASMLPANRPTPAPVRAVPPLTNPTNPNPATAETSSPTSAETLTSSPSSSPTQTLITTGAPTSFPTATVSENPTFLQTTAATESPTLAPTKPPTSTPTTPNPTFYPTSSPTNTPTASPTGLPTRSPTESPTTARPTSRPTKSPSKRPTAVPTNTPTHSPTTAFPTLATGNPTGSSTIIESLSEAPTKSPSLAPNTIMTEETKQELGGETTSSSYFWSIGREGNGFLKVDVSLSEDEVVVDIPAP